MAQNLTRSSSGTLGSSASCSTRSLKSSHESSRLKYRELSSRSGVGGAATGGGASATGSWPTSVLWSDSAGLVMNLQAQAGRSMLPVACVLAVGVQRPQRILQLRQERKLRVGLPELDQRLAVVVELGLGDPASVVLQRLRLRELVGRVDRRGAGRVARDPGAMLALALLVGLDRGVLCHYANQLGDAGAEPLRDLGEVGVGVLHHVVQQRGGHHLVIEPLRVEQPSDRGRMIDVGVVSAPRAVMRLDGQLVGLFQEGRASDEFGTGGHAPKLPSKGRANATP